MDDRKTFLMEMYRQMFADINRQMTVVWQAVSVVVGAFALLALVVHPARAEVDLPKLISVLIELEGGKWGDDYGGAARISYSSWSDRSPLSYQLSKHREYAMPVYLAHLRWIEKQLVREKRKVTPFNLGIVWRRGLQGAKRLEWKDDYATRCQKLLQARLDTWPFLGDDRVIDAIPRRAIFVDHVLAQHPLLHCPEAANRGP